MDTVRTILIIILIACVCAAVAIVITEMQKYRQPLDDCSHLTNETYNDYPNSNVCRFNGTGWEPLFYDWNSQLKGSTNGINTHI